MATSRLQILDGALSERTDTRISTGDLSDPVGGGGDAATLPRSVSEVRGTGGGAETLLSQVASAVSGNSAHAVSMLAFVLDEEEGRHHRDVESAMAAKELKRTLRQVMPPVCMDTSHRPNHLTTGFVSLICLSPCLSFCPLRVRIENEKCESSWCVME